MNLIVNSSSDIELLEKFYSAVEKAHGKNVHGAKAAEIRRAIEDRTKLLEAQKK